MKTTTAIFLALTTSSAIAQNLNFNVVAKTEVNKAPTFFFKATPDGKYISYTLPSDPSQPGAGGINIIHDTTTHKEVRIPGPWDPVFNAGSEFMTLPYRYSGNNVYYQFYKVSDLLSQGTNAKPLGQDQELGGLYQSVGKLAETNADITYRVIAEGPGSHNYRDYKINKQNFKVQALGLVENICTNFSLKLPMISKDGQELGALDVRTGKTTILKVEANGKCTKLFDLGDKFGKVNFSYDKRYLTFHKYNTSNPNITDGFVDIPTKSTTADIYLYDRVTKKLNQLTSNKASNALYPEFLANGDIIYINHPHNNAAEKVSFITVRPKFITVNDESDFFQHLDEYQNAGFLADYIKLYLISNNSIKIKDQQDFETYFSLVQKAQLEWPFVQKMATDGFSLVKTDLLAKSLMSNTKLASFLLSEERFLDYKKSLQTAMDDYLKDPKTVAEDFRPIFEKFVARSEKTTFTDESFDFFLQRFNKSDEVLIDIIIKGIDQGLDFNEHNLFRFFTAGRSKDLIELVIGATDAENYPSALLKYVQATNLANLSKEMALMVYRAAIKSLSYEIANVEEFYRVLDLAWNDNEWKKIASDTPIKLGNFNYIQYALYLSTSPRRNAPEVMKAVMESQAIASLGKAGLADIRIQNQIPKLNNSLSILEYQVEELLKADRTYDSAVVKLVLNQATDHSGFTVPHFPKMIRLGDLYNRYLTLETLFNKAIKTGFVLNREIMTEAMNLTKIDFAMIFIKAAGATLNRDLFVHILKESGMYRLDSIKMFTENSGIQTSRADLKLLRQEKVKKSDREKFELLKKFIKENKGK